ncbi:MAG: glutaredoxin family protein [Spirochaetota bacterium]
MIPKRYAIIIILLILMVFQVAAPDEPIPKSSEKPVFYLFHSYSCSHCKKARDFIPTLKNHYPDIEFRLLEIEKNRENQALLGEFAKKLEIKTPGIPVFVFGESYIVGFRDGKVSRGQLIAMIEFELGKMSSREPQTDSLIQRVIYQHKLSLPLLTVFIGLVDGVNPCALWVLMLLLGLLINVGGKRRMIIVGGIFIFFSAIMYFIFMTAWLNFFTLLGFRKIATLILGIGVSIIGIINVKELFWFKGGVSLIIPEKAKPGIYKRMRKIVTTTNIPLLLFGTASLAFFVNLAEFGCTAGFPAIYTRILSVQRVATWKQYLYMILYNSVYVVPLMAVLAIFILTMGNYRLTPGVARVIKVAGGFIMLTFGLTLIIRPELMILT